MPELTILLEECTASTQVLSPIFVGTVDRSPKATLRLSYNLS
jgi:hypothetical protein